MDSEYGGPLWVRWQESLGLCWYSLHHQYSPPIIFILGTLLLHHIIFWSASILLLLLDLTKKPTFLHNFKIQKDLISWQDARKCIETVLINQFIVMLPFIVIIYYAFVANGGLIFSLHVPKWDTILLHIFGCIVIEEILFYYSHRLLHTPRFYQAIHKVHHQFRAPVGMAAEYSHPIEFLISSLIPIMVGPLVLRAHIVTTWIWFSIAIIGTISHHSGYEFPWFVGALSPTFHDYHHYRFTFNFGLLGWLDRIHGTYATNL